MRKESVAVELFGAEWNAQPAHNVLPTQHRAEGNVSDVGNCLTSRKVVARGQLVESRGKIKLCSSHATHQGDFKGEQ
jgi:hypothetical protein